MITIKKRYVAATAGALWVAYLSRKQLMGKTDKVTLKQPTDAQLRVIAADAAMAGKKERRGVDKQFINQLKEMLKIVLPSVRSKEFLILMLHSSFLVMRTWLSIYVLRLNGTIVKTVVDRDHVGFGKNMLKWFAIAIPATYSNSMIRFLEAKLAIAFRTRMSEYVYKLYMENETYYRVGNLDSRLANADQCLTEDVSKMCSLMAHLHSHVSKPVLDVILFTSQLFLFGFKRHGPKATIGPFFLAMSVVFITATSLKVLAPPFGRLVAEQAKKEGELRFVHSRLITNAEEVAFYGGEKIEKGILRSTYHSLIKHVNIIYQKRIFYNMLEGFLMKYFWTACGMTMIAMPAFSQARKERLNELTPTDVVDMYSTPEVSVRTEEFIVARGLLTNAAEAVERIMSAYKEVTELSGYMARVSQMIQVFNDMKREHYEKTTIGSSSPASSRKAGKSYEMLPTPAKAEVGDQIKFDQVPILTPNGDLLVDKMSFDVKPGMHMLITGPNGCGKSSLFRILGGLWPVYGGTVVKPRPRDMFYIPQRPYLCLGTLRDQVIYPDTHADMTKRGRDDDFLTEILSIVHLNHIVDREGGWDAINDWADVLSGGEKQRVAMARLFYHKPLFAILDECTSAVSIDVEGKMYQHAIDVGITLLTVTHRPTLWKYHNYLLQFDGDGGYNFTQLNASTRLTLKEEKSSLESELAGVPHKQRRLKELCALLGEDTVLATPTQSPPDSP